MIKVPEINIASNGAHLMTGQRLNELVAALQARTQLDATEAGPQGMRGINPGGSAVKIKPFRAQFDPKKTYVLSPAFLQRLDAAIKARTPREAASLDGSGWSVGGAGVDVPMRKPGADGAALKEMLGAVQSITPRDTAETGLMGYRFKDASRSPRQAALTLQTEDQWAEAFFCAGISQPGVLYTTHTFVNVYAHGTITTTATQTDIGPHVVSPADPTRFTCPAITIHDDRVAGRDYGSEISGSDSYSGAVDEASALSVAEGAIAPNGTVEDVYVWMWGEFSPPPDTSTYAHDLARYISPSLGDYIFHQPRYRWSNTGKLHIGVHWKEGGTPRSIVVAPGEITSWYESTPTGIIGVSGQLTNLELTYPAT
jgi:hypothetical protein